MKVAEVKYKGSVSHKRHRGPSGEMYRFDDGDEEVTTFADARYFDRKPNFEVEFTARGELANKFVDGAKDAREAIEEMHYQTKRSLASKVDVEPDSQSEEDLDDALEDVAESLRQRMDN